MNTFEGHKLLSELISDNPALLVYFYNDECAPCVQLRPKVEKLIADAFPSMEILFIETKQYPELTSEYNIYTSPVIIAFFGGKEFYRWSKFISTDQLGAELERPYSLLFS